MLRSTSAHIPDIRDLTVACQGVVPVRATERVRGRRNLASAAPYYRMMILTLLEIFGAAGFYGLAFVAVAYAAWELGVRDPFLLTVLALVLGGVLGFWLTVAFDKLVTKKRAADEQG